MKQHRILSVACNSATSANKQQYPQHVDGKFANVVAELKAQRIHALAMSAAEATQHPLGPQDVAAAARRGKFLAAHGIERRSRS